MNINLGIGKLTEMAAGLQRTSFGGFFCSPSLSLWSQGVSLVPVPWLYTLTRIPERLSTGSWTPDCFLETCSCSSNGCGNFTEVPLANWMLSKREEQWKGTTCIM